MNINGLEKTPSSNWNYSPYEKIGQSLMTSDIDITNLLTPILSISDENEKVFSRDI